MSKARVTDEACARWVDHQLEQMEFSRTVHEDRAKIAVVLLMKVLEAIPKRNGRRSDAITAVLGMITECFPAECETAAYNILDELEEHD